MSTVEQVRERQPWFRRLYLPAYQISTAARYVGVHPSTVSAWHTRRDPVLPGRVQGQALSYLELIEVAFVAFFRKLGVSMSRIREARAYVAQVLGKEYPFAEYRFKSEGMNVLMEFSQFASDPSFAKLIAVPDTDPDKIVVASMHGQLAWEQLMGSKFAEFDYEFELALRWHPATYESAVVIDPRYSFGAPVVNGLPTWVVKGRYDAQESIDEIVEEFGIPRESVLDALNFEGVPTAELLEVS